MITAQLLLCLMKRSGGYGGGVAVVVHCVQFSWILFCMFLGIYDGHNLELQAKIGQQSL